MKTIFNFIGISVIFCLTLCFQTRISVQASEVLATETPLVGHHTMRTIPLTTETELLKPEGVSIPSVVFRSSSKRSHFYR